MAAATWQQHEDVIEQLKRIADALEAGLALRHTESVTATIPYWPLTTTMPAGGPVTSTKYTYVNEANDGFVGSQPVRG